MSDKILIGVVAAFVVLIVVIYIFLTFSGGYKLNSGKSILGVTKPTRKYHHGRSHRTATNKGALTPLVNSTCQLGSQYKSIQSANNSNRQKHNKSLHLEPVGENLFSRRKPNQESLARIAVASDILPKQTENEIINEEILESAPEYIPPLQESQTTGDSLLSNSTTVTPEEAIRAGEPSEYVPRDNFYPGVPPGGMLDNVGVVLEGNKLSRWHSPAQDYDVLNAYYHEGKEL